MVAGGLRRVLKLGRGRFSLKVTDRGVTYELLRDPGFDFTDALGVIRFPVTLLVEPDGRVVHQHGAIDGDELREMIASLWGIR